MDERKDHPVLWGLVALVAVAGAVGVLLGIGALGVSRVLGLGGDSSGASTQGATMYLPTPSDTSESSSSQSSSDDPNPGGGHKPGHQSSSPADTGITLKSAEQSVSPMGQIDLSGSYPGGSGAILQVQRFEGGSWTDFPVTTSVDGDTFSTYIMTGHTGVNRFRVVDTNTKTSSNEVKVTVG